MANPLSADDLLSLVQSTQISAIKGIEDKAIKAATESRFAAIDDAIKSATQQWIKEFGSIGADGSGKALDAMIRSALGASNTALSGLDKSVVSALTEAVGSAVTTATSQGQAFVAAATGRPALAQAAHSAPALDAEKAAVKTAMEEGQKGFRSLLKRKFVEKKGLRGILGGLQQARNAVGRAVTTITTSVNHNVTKTMQATAAANKAPFELWVSERDACVRCTKYAGRLVKTGESFPGGLSWDPNDAEKMKDATDVRPPLHPHCRCRLVPWDPTWAKPGEVSLPDAVSREAQRSVARGFSLPGESNASRIRAAKELLSGNPQLPKTVIAAAKKAVAKGEFPKGRSVPNP